MLLEKARLILAESVESDDIEDLLTVKKFLTRKDINTLSLSMFEIEGLWLKFSWSLCASFIVVNEDTLKEFLQWLN